MIFCLYKKFRDSKTYFLEFFIPLLQSSRYTFVIIFLLLAFFNTLEISLKWSFGVFFNWCFKWLREPLVSRFWTLQFDFDIHSIDNPLSTKVSTSIQLIFLFFLAQLVIFFTDSSSPSETLAEATSILSILSLLIRNFAIVNFSLGV